MIEEEFRHAGKIEQPSTTYLLDIDNSLEPRQLCTMSSIESRKRAACGDDLQILGSCRYLETFALQHQDMLDPMLLCIRH